MSTQSRVVIALLTAMLLVPWCASADDEVSLSSQARGSDTVTLYLENDLFGFRNKDRYYTHGTKLSWISRDLVHYRDIVAMPSWAHRLIEQLPSINDARRRHTVSVSLGQNIYTPEDKDRGDLIPDDRPYAGTTYLAFGIHSKDSRQMDSVELAVGIVGRHSYAQDCQIEIHKRIGSVKPRGWQHQLHDEPVLNVYFERKWKYLEPDHLQAIGFDVIPHLGIAAGTVYTGLNMGAQVRIGWNLPNDYGTYLIRPGSDSNAPLDDADPRFFLPRQRLGFHFFGAVDGRVVARNLFLDGNTFRDSHSVSKKPVVVDFIGGVGMIVHRCKLTYSYVYRTKEFRGQRRGHQFGALSVSYTF